MKKEKKKNPGKDNWETLNVITLIPLVGVNHRLPILHISKIMVHCYSTDEIINQFAIGYMINPSLNCSKVFREKLKNSEVFYFMITQWKLLKFFWGRRIHLLWH